MVLDSFGIGDDAEMRRMARTVPVLTFLCVFDATSTSQPVGGVGTCQAQDPDGDISLWNGTFQMDGTILFAVVAGTGKWATLTGAKFQGKTRQSLGDASVYDFKPVN